MTDGSIRCAQSISSFSHGDRLRCLSSRTPLQTDATTEHRPSPGKAEALPEAVMTPSGLKITPLNNSVPDAADVLIQQAYSLLPPIKITEWRVEVDKWTDFTRPFTPLKTGDLAKHKSLLL